MDATRDVILQVPDLDAAAAFYETVVGLRVFERSATLLGFDAGSFRLFVEPGGMPGPVFEFHTDDLRRKRTALVKAGCVIVDDDPSVPRCYLRDPFGLMFNIAASGG